MDTIEFNEWKNIMDIDTVNRQNEININVNRNIMNDLMNNYLYKHADKDNFQIIYKESTECELFKYTLNSYLAVKVWYFNKINDIAESLNINYDSLKELFPLDSRIGKYGTVVPGDHGRCYSGHCLVKDTKALCVLQQELKLDTSGLSSIIKDNDNMITNAESSY